ncbi:MAG TPA: hypothetical protein VK659_08450 [Asanoa sp.]|nr:hypothetical protein [Asanoa sp.]
MSANPVLVANVYVDGWPLTATETAPFEPRAGEVMSMNLAARESPSSMVRLDIEFGPEWLPGWRVARIRLSVNTDSVCPVPLPVMLYMAEPRLPVPSAVVPMPCEWVDHPMSGKVFVVALRVA